jgi:hypothetical protein
LISTIILLAGAFPLFGQARTQPQAPQGGEAKRFLGTWRLVSDGQTGAFQDSHPVGLIYYDGTGHVAAQIMPDRSRRKPADAGPASDDSRSVIAGYIAYFGTFTVDPKERTVTHHREGNLTSGGVGVDLVRRYEFDSKDRLILTPVEAPTVHLTWERIK